MFSGDVMGTGFNVRLLAPGRDEQGRQELENAVNSELSAVDDLMTTYRDSEVTRFNRWQSLEAFAVSEATAQVVALALDLAIATEGALDITIAPLVEALGFGAASPPGPISTADLEALRGQVGYFRLSIDPEGRLLKGTPELQIDLSAVAKGFAVDRAAAALEHLAIDDYLIEVGGEIRAKGVNEEGVPWRVGIERPSYAGTRRTQRVLALRNLALATSGDYRNYREVDGQRLSHLIDPRSGASIDHRVASATVVHPDCATADGLATAMMVLGESGLELAEARGWAVLMIARDGDRFVELHTTAFRRLVESADREGT